MKRRAIWKLAGAFLLALLGSAGAGAAPGLALAPSHTFDPVLSLTGGCTVSSYDPIPDPPRESGPQSEEISECEAGPHPAESFVKPTGIATDSYGNIYVAAEGPNAGGVQPNPHVDIFGPDGGFLTVVSTPVEPKTLAVDSKGYLYAYTNTEGEKLLRYDPASGYEPDAGEIAYEPTPTVIDPAGWPFWSFYASLTVNPGNDHLFVNFGSYLDDLGVKIRSAIVEFGSGTEGNPLLDDEVAEVKDGSLGLAIDQSRGRLYATDKAPDPPGTSPPDQGARLIQVFELAAPHNLIETLDGSSLPEGTFVKCGFEPEICGRELTIAADESSGNLFAYDIEKERVIYELDEDGQYLATIEHDLLPKTKAQITVDNGANSPNGALHPEGRYLWAVDSPPGVGHADAFKPTLVGPPEVEVSFGNVTEDEALLEAQINPNQAETTYSFEYVSRAQFDVGGFAAARVAGQGTVAAGTLPVPVSAQARGLSPGTAYVFRVVAENEASPPLGEAEGEFKTYPAIHFASCPNDAMRTGPSAALPDCRAYELVTPPDTAGRPPLGLGFQRVPFPALPASPAGDRVSFRIENGLIPGLDATASLSGDPYLSSRGPGSWRTEATGGDGTETVSAAPGGRSPDQNYSAWAAEVEGPAVIGGERTIYVRYPDGHSELFGQGSLRTDPQPEPKLISKGAGHMLFASSLRLEEEAPPAGLAIYDRTADGQTHVVSLLPGDQTPSGAQQVTYRGSSLDGRGVAFEITEGVTTLYLRRDNQTTYEIGTGLIFEGVAEGGARVFYLQAGNLKAFDAASGSTTSFAGGGDVTVVNVSADGSTAYFVSPDKLTSNPNPLGDRAIVGEENLYRSHEGTISFLATVSKRDVEGEGANVRHNGLGLWVNAVHGAGSATETPGRFAIDPSRSTADGSTLLFQSDADLTAYEANGTRQVYRYDAAANQLACLSCNPTGAPPRGDALLQEVSESAAKAAPNTSYDVVWNLAAGGRRAFFQSPDPLVAADINGLQDVYEWEAPGVGSCGEATGCLYLISSGQSARVSYLYAAGESGNDVFFRTADLLVPADKEAIPSIYDARVGGGFTESAPQARCEGEGCRPQLSAPPLLPTPGMAPGRSGNVAPKCPKSKRRVKRAGKVRCVKKRRHHRRAHHRRHAGKGTKGGRR